MSDIVQETEDRRKWHTLHSQNQLSPIIINFVVH